MLKTIGGELWIRICNGDKRSFELLYSAYSKSLYQYGLHFTSKEEVIEDVIQDLFIHIFNNHNKLNRKVNVRAYLIGSFRNNLFRCLSRENRYCSDEGINYTFDGTYSIEHRIMASEEDLFRKKKLLAAMAKLTARQKELIYLRFTKGFDYEEIAQIWDMELQSVRNAMSRSIRALRGEYESCSVVLLNIFSKKS